MSSIYLCCFNIVSPGYVIAYNATEYEFYVNVYSPVGTAVLDALLIVEDLPDTVAVVVNLVGDDADSFVINGMNGGLTFFPVETLENPLLSITLDETLDPNDENTDYNFMITYSATTTASTRYEGSINILLHEIGKLDIICTYVAMC